MAAGRVFARDIPGERSDFARIRRSLQREPSLTNGELSTGAMTERCGRGLRKRRALPHLLRAVPLRAKLTELEAARSIDRTPDDFRPTLLDRFVAVQPSSRVPPDDP